MPKISADISLLQICPQIGTKKLQHKNAKVGLTFEIFLVTHLYLTQMDLIKGDLEWLANQSII